MTNSTIILICESVGFLFVIGAVLLDAFKHQLHVPLLFGALGVILMIAGIAYAIFTRNSSNTPQQESKLLD